MNLVVCPHCKSHRIVTAKVPKDVVVVMPCPSCSELVVLYRKKVIALDRSVLESGTMDDRKDHIAEVIAEFIEPNMFGALADDGGESEPEIEETSKVRPRRRRRKVEQDENWAPPISDREMDQYKVELEQLDNPDYFKKHFG